MIRIMFVCSGNICRSPMAAGLAESKLADREVDALIVSSGTLGINGRPAATFGQMAMEEIGLDISSHYSQGIQRAMLAAADHIVVMAPRHETFIARTVPEVTPKIVRMWEWADEDLDKVYDPVGQDLQAFRECRDLLDRALENWFESLDA